MKHLGSVLAAMLLVLCLGCGGGGGGSNGGGGGSQELLDHQSVTIQNGGGRVQLPNATVTFPTNCIPASGQIDGSYWRGSLPKPTNDNQQLDPEYYTVSVPAAPQKDVQVSADIGTAEAWVQWSNGLLVPLEKAQEGSGLVITPDVIEPTKGPTVTVRLVIVRYRQNTELPTTFIEWGSRAHGTKALVLHGIGGSGKSMENLKDTLTSKGYGYVLAPDYDYNKHIDDIMGDVGDYVLRNFSAGTKFDLYAHSMGGLVGRGMIELNKLAPYVDRIFLLGTPNIGAGALKKDGYRHSFTWLVRLRGANNNDKRIRKIDDDTPSIVDMTPDSAFLQRLNSSNNPKNTANYFALAGTDHRNIPINLYPFEQSDGVVEISSAKWSGLQGRTRGRVFTDEIALNHSDLKKGDKIIGALQSFWDREGQAPQLETWFDPAVVKNPDWQGRWYPDFHIKERNGRSVKVIWVRFDEDDFYGKNRVKQWYLVPYPDNELFPYEYTEWNYDLPPEGHVGHLAYDGDIYSNWNDSPSEAWGGTTRVTVHAVDQYGKVIEATNTVIFRSDQHGDPTPPGKGKNRGESKARQGISAR